MEYADYVRQISFRLLKPETPRPTGFRALNQLARKAGFHLEMWMTQLPEGQEQMQRRLRRVCRVKRCSTFAIGAIINRGVDRLTPAQAYLNIGVGSGFSLFAGMAGHRRQPCIGVDSFSQHAKTKARFLKRFERWKSPRHEFHELDFRKYLGEVHHGSIGFCTCDGLKTYQDQYDALRMLEPHLAEGGIVLLDDTNWEDVNRAVANFLVDSPFEYRVLLDIHTPRSGHPTFWNGVILLERRERKATSVPFVPAERRAA